jgi:glycosyltransferase involved in cell wall biosynthesis
MPPMPAQGTTRKLRVLTLLDVLLPIGGAERLAVQIALNLDRERFEPFVCATRRWRRTGVLDELEEVGIPTLRLERRSAADVLPWRRLVSLLRRERIDVIHAHQFGSNVWAAVLGRLTAVPVVVAHEHSWSFEGQPLRRFLDRNLVARGADAVIAVSDEDRRQMIEVEGVEPRAIRVVPNGIRVRGPTGHDVRAELEIPPAAPVVGTVSVLRPEKALEVLVEAAALLAAEFPGLRVLIVGTGKPEVEAELRALIGKRRLGDTVLLLGLRTDVGDLLEAFDVAVICSDREGAPLAVMEYMAAARPVVATRVGGLPLLVEDGVNGLLVPPRDPAALAAAVAELLSDPARRAELGARGRELQQREHDFDVMTRRIEDIYEELFARTRRARREGWRPLPR